MDELVWDDDNATIIVSPTSASLSWNPRISDELLNGFLHMATPHPVMRVEHHRQDNGRIAMTMHFEQQVRAVG